jgi:hypothetical protein
LVDKLEWLKDFQIVNGGQTTASVYPALKKEKVDVSQVVVQVKLTKRDPVRSTPRKLGGISYTGRHVRGKVCEESFACIGRRFPFLV